jgi:hydroxymethylpyrimidine pyrophosphatase-like HAD family hydrolase
MEVRSRGAGSSSGSHRLRTLVQVLPIRAGKGAALQFIRECVFPTPKERCLVAGDSGNDASMFLYDGGFRGVMVGNAKAELLAVQNPAIHVVTTARCRPTDPRWLGH